ncbi:MAG: hypothetical protein IPP01_03305 [Saprospiraceae bacterium]|jgi:hypothetical protein|nr:hypothetical protein [Saprospiraceae bacterium]
MNTFSKSILKFAFLGLLIFAFSCSKSDSDDTTTKGCDKFGPTTGTAVINGNSNNLILAQYLLTDDFGDFEHGFQIGGVSSDCNELITFGFDIENSNSSPAGTYPIKSLSSSGINTATGNVIQQKVSPVSQSFVEMKSGQIVIKVVGTKKFEITLNAVLTDQSNVSLKATQQF